MKKIKYIISIIIIALVASMAMTSCSSDDDNNGSGGYGNLEKPDPKFESKVYFVTNLKDQALATDASSYVPINNFFKEKGKPGCWLGIIDRADAVYSPTSMFNGSVRTAFESDLFSTGAFNKFNGSTIEGSTLLFPNYYTDKKSIKVTNDCYVTAIQLMMKGRNHELEIDFEFDVPFRTARFDSDTQIKTFAESIFRDLKAGRLNLLMMGTIRKELVESLRAGVANVDEHFVVKIAEGTENSEYCIYLLANEYFWDFRGVEKRSLGTGIDLYELSLMW